MIKKILLIGNGAREHVIAETLMRSKHTVELHTLGKSRNPGIESLSTSYTVGDYKNQLYVCEVARSIKPDFVFIGPDDPIGAGLADALLKEGFKSVAPLKVVAQLESSKSFTRNLVQKYGIPGNPCFKVFTNGKGMEEFMRELDGQFVVKYDGLRGGKGVKVVGDHLTGIEDGLAYAKECLQELGQVVIEEKFIGQEFSLMSFADGNSLAHMPPVQDHKRAFNDDKGPNTGGMGTYSDANHLLPFLTQDDVTAAQKINEEVLLALKVETGTAFKGVMYGGFIAVKHGVRLIEYNARFGDPEAMNVLPILMTDFVDICEAMIEGTLDKLKVEFEKKATVCKYVVPEGYPDSPKKGAAIEIGPIPEGVDMYYGSVDKTEKELRLTSSRAVAFIAKGNTIEEAAKKTGEALRAVHGHVFYRTDIGTEESIRKKIEFMRGLRG